MKPLIKVRVDAAGTPCTMRLVPLEVQAPGPGEVWLEQAAIGVNPLDVSQRKGAVPMAFSSGPGLVDKVHPGGGHERLSPAASIAESSR